MPEGKEKGVKVRTTNGEGLAEVIRFPLNVVERGVDDIPNSITEFFIYSVSWGFFGFLNPIRSEKLTLPLVALGGIYLRRLGFAFSKWPRRSAANASAGLLGLFPLDKVPLENVRQ
jgi:hypothetical protein